MTDLPVPGRFAANTADFEQYKMLPLHPQPKPAALRTAFPWLGAKPNPRPVYLLPSQFAVQGSCRDCLMQPKPMPSAVEKHASFSSPLLMTHQRLVAGFAAFDKNQMFYTSGLSLYPSPNYFQIKLAGMAA